MDSLKGRKFNSLLVMGDPIRSGKHYYCLCRCDCGNEKLVRKDAILNGNTKSCGCKRTRKSSNKSGSRHSDRNKLYHVWYGMKRRCENIKDTSYFKYGGRGIKVCDEWSNNFEAFYQWAMKSGYDPKAPKSECTLDRIDNNGNYEPSNCRWANMTIQSNNRRNSITLTYQGETHTVAEWAKKVGLNHGALLNRIHKGWSVEKALTTPSSKGNRWFAERYI